MPRDQKKISPGKPFVLLLLIVNAIVLEQALVSNEKWYWLLLITVPLLLIAMFF